MKIRTINFVRQIRVKLLSRLRIQATYFPQSGFTIVEVLVVAAVLAVIGYMMSDIITRSLQGSRRTIVIGTAKQNGQVALDTIGQVLRNSESVICVDNQIPSLTNTTVGDSIALSSQDGRYVRLRYDGASSSLIQDLPSVGVLINNITNFSNRVCDTTLSPSIPNSQIILTDTDTTNGVLIQKVGGSAPVFTLTKKPGSKDKVTVQFEVRPRIVGGGGYENQLGGSGAILFQETVQLR